MNLDSSTFETLAGSTLEAFMEAIDGTLGEQLDVDLEQGILTIELAGGGQYVLNKHAPSQQIWMSSPVSGATHFDYREQGGGWVSSRGDELLAPMLSGELEQATGIRVSLG
ncbi:MAG: iron donor protein CyaY [Rhodospirillaceae bacterium]|nr:iron donor protein CyaY [Rhodospirillaceae bacterium]